MDIGCHDWSLLSKRRTEHFDGVLLELVDVIIKPHILKMNLPEVLLEEFVGLNISSTIKKWSLLEGFGWARVV